VSLRGRFIAYLVVIHLAFAGVAGVVLRAHTVWLPAFEAFFLLSFLAGLWLLRSLFEPVDLLRSSVEFIEAGEFSTRLRETGRPELDPLIRVYNRMADTLRQERIRSEEQEMFLERIIRASPSGILTLDLDGRVTMANPAACAFLQREAGELEGRSLADAGSPLADALAALGPEQSRVVPLQGSRRVRCQASTFMDRGFARRFLVLDEMTEELHRSEKAAYEKLIRLMSHEVGNTASAVGSLLDSCLASARLLPEPERADYAGALGIAIARVGRMNEFMQGFAEVVRLPAPRRQPCDLRGLLEDVTGLFREDAGTRRVAWVWEVTGGPLLVSLDRGQMEQVLVNVVKNALEAIGTDGTITIRLGCNPSRPFTVLEDSGSGIPEDVRDQLFTPFFTTKPDGQGLGLTLAREVLLAHGFDFSLENAPGGGARFTILF